MPPANTVAFVIAFESSQAEGNNIGLFYRAVLTGGQVVGGSKVIEGDLVFSLIPNPITAYEATIVATIISAASSLGITIQSNDVFFPVYKRG
jgi:hypothetical protein